MSVLEGNPPLLTTRAEELQITSGRIGDVIDALHGIVADDEAKAVEALHELADDVRGQLTRVHGRYDGTALAITDYAVALTEAHTRADAAQEDLETAQTAAVAASDEVTAWQTAIDNAPAGADTRLYEQGRDAASMTLAAANSAAVEAADRIQQARDDMEEAAEEARDRIEDAIADTNEGLRDKVGAFFDRVGDFFRGVGEWFADFFNQVLDFLQKLAATITAILSVLAILLLIVAIGALFGPIGLILGLTIASALAALIVWRIASDVLAPDPTVTPFTPPAEDVLDIEPSLESVLDSTTEVDGLSNTDETAIKITKVLGPDGWHYTITLPSTQEWLTPFGDGGPVNDLDSNLALMLTPSLATQYERAVVDAMEQAGITADDNVMLVGFSQGGIVAGHLAAYNSDLGIDAVVVSGAPIDHMPIPDSVDVVSVQHDFDPVPRLDSLVGNGAPNHGSNWTTISEPSPLATSAVDVKNIHNSRAYSSTFEANIDEIRANHPDLDHYFARERGLPSVSTYYRWNE